METQPYENFKNYANPDKLQRAQKLVRDAGGDPEDKKIVYEVYKRMAGYVDGDNSTKLPPVITEPSNGESVAELAQRLVDQKQSAKPEEAQPSKKKKK